MTDEELICSLMEPKPAHWAEPGTATEWWVRTELGWMPYPLTLDALREVEERLTDEQWQRYAVTLDLATRTRLTTTVQKRCYSRFSRTQDRRIV